MYISSQLPVLPLCRGEPGFSMGADDFSYKAASSTSGNVMDGGGVAAKLMAKMGYQSGTGLGMLYAG